MLELIVTENSKLNSVSSKSIFADEITINNDIIVPNNITTYTLFATLIDSDNIVVDILTTTNKINTNILLVTDSCTIKLLVNDNIYAENILNAQHLNVSTACVLYGTLHLSGKSYLLDTMTETLIVNNKLLVKEDT